MQATRACPRSAWRRGDIALEILGSGGTTPNDQAHSNLESIRQKHSNQLNDFIPRKRLLSQGLRPCRDNLQISVVGEDPPPLTSRRFASNAELCEILQRAGDCWNRKVKRFGRSADIDEGLPLHIFVHAQRG